MHPTVQLGRCYNGWVCFPTVVMACNLHTPVSQRHLSLYFQPLPSNMVWLSSLVRICTSAFDLLFNYGAPKSSHFRDSGHREKHLHWSLTPSAPRWGRFREGLSHCCWVWIFGCLFSCLNKSEAAFCSVYDDRQVYMTEKCSETLEMGPLFRTFTILPLCDRFIQRCRAKEWVTWLLMGNKTTRGFYTRVLQHTNVRNSL